MEAAIQIQGLRDTLKREVKQGDELLPFESCISYLHLKRYPLVMWQMEWPLGWNTMDGLFQFVTRVLTYVIDEDVFPQWSHNVEDLPEGHRAFMGMDTDHIVTGGQVLLLLLAPLYLMPAPKGRCQDESYSPSMFVYSAVMVLIHPNQEFVALGDGVKVLLSTSSREHHLGHRANQ